MAQRVPIAPGPDDFQKPPCLTNAQGEPRAVGVEIEFAGLSARACAELIAGAGRGRLREEGPHLFRVEGLPVGTVTIELDSVYLQPREGDPWRDIFAKLATFFGAAASYLIPCELVTGPLPFDRLHHVDALIGVLREAGARGTQDNPLYAFGLHFNPEVPSLETESILAVVKSYALLNSWIRRQIEPDLMRSLLGFADPYPPDYVRLIAAPDYRPDQAGFIDDYLAANPTRHRDCDLLPLIAHLDMARVRAVLPHDKIRPRPTFHFRLPDARVSDPGWSIAPDWNRWVAVEKLAADRDRLARLGETYLGFEGTPKLWADIVERLALS